MRRDEPAGERDFEAIRKGSQKIVRLIEPMDNGSAFLMLSLAIADFVYATSPKELHETIVTNLAHAVQRVIYNFEKQNKPKK